MSIVRYGMYSMSFYVSWSMKASYYSNRCESYPQQLFGGLRLNIRGYAEADSVCLKTIEERSQILQVLSVKIYAIRL